MPTCSFCGKPYGEGTGFTLFKHDGTGLRYCSRKCERNSQLKRNPAKLKWTAKYVKGTTRK
ncbi:MAG: 50S ribosomal protein L24e [Candidatus Micrarchaeia archaeon]|jgi:large subunit ribosomal protein L24e